MLSHRNRGLQSNGPVLRPVLSDKCDTLNHNAYDDELELEDMLVEEGETEDEEFDDTDTAVEDDEEAVELELELELLDPEVLEATVELELLDV